MAFQNRRIAINQQRPWNLDRGVEMKSAEKELVEQRYPAAWPLSHQVCALRPRDPGETRCSLAERGIQFVKSPGNNADAGWDLLIYQSQHLAIWPILGLSLGVESSAPVTDALWPATAVKRSRFSRRKNVQTCLICLSASPMANGSRSRAYRFNTARSSRWWRKSGSGWTEAPSFMASTAV